MAVSLNSLKPMIRALSQRERDVFSAIANMIRTCKEPISKTEWLTFRIPEFFNKGNPHTRAFSYRLSSLIATSTVQDGLLHSPIFSDVRDCTNSEGKYSDLQVRMPPWHIKIVLMIHDFLTINTGMGELKSRYGVPLYRFLNEHRKAGQVVVEIDKLREILELEPTAYALFGNIKSQILIPIQKEFTAKADFTFTFDVIKSDRRSDGLWFKLQELKF